MIAYLNIVKGTLKGFRFKALPGITIGGPESHINLKDESISGVHAKIINDENNELYIKAEKTQIGIYLNDKRVKQGHLGKDAKVTIGNTIFKVTLKEKPQVVDSQPEQHTDQWLDIIKKKYQEVSKLSDERPINLIALKPIVNLHFIRGLQLKTDWMLGYGPRIIGPESVVYSYSVFIF